MYLVCAGNDTCIPCEIGKYNELTGRSDCLQCPAGSVAPSTGSSACTQCPVGTSQPASGTAFFWRYLCTWYVMCRERYVHPV